MNKNITVTVTISSKYDYFPPKTRCVEIDPLYHEDAFRQIDFPSPGTDAFTAALCCTSAEDRSKIQKARKRLSNQISEQIVFCMANNDTKNGYPKETESPTDQS